MFYREVEAGTVAPAAISPPATEAKITGVVAPPLVDTEKDSEHDTKQDTKQDKEEVQQRKRALVRIQIHEDPMKRKIPTLLSNIRLSHLSPVVEKLRRHAIGKLK